MMGIDDLSYDPVLMLVIVLILSVYLVKRIRKHTHLTSSRLRPGSRQGKWNMIGEVDKDEAGARQASWNEKIRDWIPSFDGMTVERVRRFASFEMGQLGRAGGIGLCAYVHPSGGGGSWYG